MRNSWFKNMIVIVIAEDCSKRQNATESYVNNKVLSFLAVIVPDITESYVNNKV